MKRIIFVFLLAVFLYSCVNKKVGENENIIVENIENLEVSRDKISENFDWLTEYGWALSDGRYLVDTSIDRSTTDWIGLKTPLVTFEKFDIPPNSVLYQMRLRKELFSFRFQTDEKDKLFSIGSALGASAFDLIFYDNFTRMSLIDNGWPKGRQERVGQQENPDYPIVGIWGELPYLTEYRLLDFTDCMYYMEIDKDIPKYAVREGTYLFKQTGENTFETISSFSDGCMKLEIEDERSLILTPLFTLSDEEGWVAPLVVDRTWPKSELLNSALAEDEY